MSSPALALPEAARYGQFTCMTCHVSPAGGGSLTSYGRDFSASKLSTWHYDFEEDPMHGLIPVSDRVIMGADARWVKYHAKTGDQTIDKFWRMQTDLEGTLHLGPAWVTCVMGTKPAGPMEDPKDYSHLIHRGYSARVDLFDEHVIARAGLFMPKFGLMLADHTALVRMASGLTPDSEQTQGELTYQTDDFEITAAMLMVNNAYDREGKSKSGYNLGAALFVDGKNRINANLLSTSLTKESTTISMMSASLSTVMSLTSMLYGMFEIDRVQNAVTINSTKTQTEVLADYASLNFEVYKGIIPYLRYEYMDADITKTDTSTSRWGAGFNWYPRPHFQFEGRVLRAVVNASHSTTDETDFLMHYYF